MHVSQHQLYACIQVQIANYLILEAIFENSKLFEKQNIITNDLIENFANCTKNKDFLW